MGLNLRYESWGDGMNTLVMLHGFTGSRASWRHLKEALSPHVRVVAVDLPGHGESPLPAATGREGWEATLEALVALIDGLEVQEVDLLGYSQGARLALGLALRMEWRVRRLMLESVNPGLKRSHERALRRAEDDALAARIEAEGIPAFVERWEQQPLFAGIRALPREIQEELRARRLSCAAGGLAGALRAMGLGVQPSYWQDLPRLHMPTLLLTGALDEKFTGIASRMRDELPLGWHCAFEGSGHAPHLEVPERYLDEILLFLQAPDSSVVGKYRT